MTPEKHRAITDYLRASFPNLHRIEEAEEPRPLWKFSIFPEADGAHFLLLIAHEFIADRSAKEIAASLKKWRVADGIRSNPKMQMLVTETGATLQRRRG